ncbi:MAG: DUF4252 domain-containing protein [Candidatus Krumholzibacteriia bacterium]
MNRYRITSIVGGLVLIAMSSGCLWAPELDRVRREIQGQLPGSRFKKEFAITLGPLSLGLARSAVRFVPDAREARAYLKEIRKVKLAVYKVEDIPSSVRVQAPAQLQELLERDWELAARINDDGERVWILYREHKGVVREIYVVVLSDDELVMIRAKGRIDRIVERAVQEHMAERGGGARADT